MTSLSVPRWKPWLIAGVALLVGALVVAAAGFAAGAMIPGLGGGAALLALGGGSLFMASRQRRRLADIELQNELRELEIARRLAGRTQLAEQVRQAEQERAEALAVARSARIWPGPRSCSRLRPSTPR